MLTYIYSLLHTVRTVFYQPWMRTFYLHLRNAICGSDLSVSRNIRTLHPSFYYSAFVILKPVCSHFYFNHNSQFFSFKKPTSSNRL